MLPFALYVISDALASAWLKIVVAPKPQNPNYLILLILLKMKTVFLLLVASVSAIRFTDMPDEANAEIISDMQNMV